MNDKYEYVWPEPLSEKLVGLLTSPLPDGQRLQVLISLCIELAKLIEKARINEEPK